MGKVVAYVRSYTSYRVDEWERSTVRSKEATVTKVSVTPWELEKVFPTPLERSKFRNFVTESMPSLLGRELSNSVFFSHTIW